MISDTISHYRILQKLGAGGMGEVYLAQDTKLDRKVALKILPPDVATDRSRMNRFVQEAKTASALNHPNIITIHEVDSTDSVHFIATEFIDGETLRNRMRQTPMKVGEVLDISMQIASALVAAHAAGIVHRDIKPENVIIRTDGYVKVLDFGLAKLTERQTSSIDSEAATKALINTDPGLVMGTIAYLSPEQARGSELDARTDIWSLGVVLYEMIAGRAPFRGETKSHTVVSILETEPPPLTTFAPDAPAELQRIVRKALTKDRDSRYQTARDLMIDLKNLRRELDLQSELERSSVPPMRRAVSGSAQVAPQPEPLPAATDQTQTPASRTTAPPAALAASQTRKRTFTIGLVALLLVTIVAGYWFLGRRTASATPIESIAVLPFANQNHDPESEYLSDGLTEGVINRLSQLPNLRVMSRNSVLRYKGKENDAREVGQQLGVQSVLTGRVSQRGDMISINVELIDARDGSHLWGPTYDRKLSDLVTVQREIPVEVADNLRITLSGEERQHLTKRYTDNAEAYRLYLRGRYFWDKRTRDGIEKATESFRQAIDLDPNYALAFAGLADCYLFNKSGLSPSETTPKAKAAAQKALELDNSLAEAHTTLGFIKERYEYDWAGAEQSYQRALQLNPNYPIAHQFYGGLFVQTGRTEEGLREARRALDLDPLSSTLNWYWGFMLFFARRYDEAERQMEQTLQMQPDSPLVQGGLGQIYAAKGMYKEAMQQFRKLGEHVDGVYESKPLLAYAYAKSGQKDEAERLLNELKKESENNYVAADLIAKVYVGLGKHDEALAWLERGYQERAFGMFFLKVDPAFDPLRSDRRFADLLLRIGLAL